MQVSPPAVSCTHLPPHILFPLQCWSTGKISHVPFFFVSAHVPCASPSRSPVTVMASASVREQPLFSEL